jgi:hypothetical protein
MGLSALDSFRRKASSSVSMACVPDAFGLKTHVRTPGRSHQPGGSVSLFPHIHTVISLRTTLLLVLFYDLQEIRAAYACNYNTVRL